MLFKNEYAWLSNMEPCTIGHEGLRYGSVEAFYQAMKTSNKSLRAPFTRLNGYEAKKQGRSLTLRSDWGAVKNSVMVYGLRVKFGPINPALGMALVNTNDLQLVESNWWHDNYWGSCTCTKCGNKGINTLGRLLMQVRKEIIACLP